MIVEDWWDDAMMGDGRMLVSDGRMGELWWYDASD
jgi:hypothetical protein